MPSQPPPWGSSLPSPLAIQPRYARLFFMDAKSFLERYWDWNIPVDVFAMAQAAGAELVPDQDLGASGQLSFDGDKPVIRYSFLEHPVRQRFTVAHELGHLMLRHGPAFRDSPDNFNVSVWDPKEVEANRFAADILMPKDAIEYLIRQKKVYSPHDMAAALNVSPIAMQFRLKNLGWLR